MEELPGILSWAVEGCLAWQRERLNPPQIVTDAVKAYRSEMDVLGQFLSDCCIIRDHGQVTAKALYRAYRGWADQSGEHAVTQRAFGLAMTERGFDKEKKRTGALYLGIELPVGTGWVD